jgi:LmbE family N-acetylglucosaminyl deacetylase
MEGIDYLGRPMPVHLYVDITATMDLKKRMLACHRSQREWLLRQHGLDEYTHSMVEWAAQRGQEAGFEHAEAFCQHRGHAYPRDHALPQILGPHLVKTVG